jgi:hypothetical protein
MIDTYILCCEGPLCNLTFIYITTRKNAPSSGYNEFCSGHKRLYIHVVAVILYLNIRHYIFVPKTYSSGLIAATKMNLVASYTATSSKMH